MIGTLVSRRRPILVPDALEAQAFAPAKQDVIVSFEIPN